MSPRIAIGVLALLITGSAFAQEVGRLFFTPEQRAALDARRKARMPDKAAATVVASPTTRVDGYVQRSTGPSTVWVNGEPLPEGTGEAPRIGPRVSVPLGDGGRRATLRPGEVLDRGTGEVRDVIGDGEIPRPALAVKLARTQRTRQRGMVVGLLIALLLLGGALFAFTSLNVASVRVDRDRDTNEVLAQAKDALIAYAVTDLTRPGQLPCPDVNNDGEATSGEDFNAATGACISLIGRLPWVTLGLPDLRDDTGERLWYAVSGDFRTDNTIPPAVPLNSDTAYRGTNVSLALIGITPATNLAAIVFSPGRALLRSDGVSQTRGCTGGAGAGCDVNLKCTSVPASNTDKCNAVNYLDLTAGEDNANLVNRIFVSATGSDSFNDRPMPIFPDDIMRLVERRAARELATNLRNHFEAWEAYDANSGFYPFAVPWNDPSSTPVSLGTNNTTAGLLPLSNAPLTWSNFSSACWTESADTVLRCQATCIFLLGIPICFPDTPSGRVDNVATRFVDPPTSANFQFVGLNLGGSGSWTLDESQRRLEFSYSGLVSVGFLDVRITAPQPSSWVSGWIARNNWHQNAYYAFAPGFAMNGNNLCGANCFSVANTSPVTTDKHAIVVITGRFLSQAATAQDPRPVGVLPAALIQYLEDGNSDAPTPTAFETKARTAAFNDTPVAVRP